MVREGTSHNLSEIWTTLCFCEGPELLEHINPICVVIDDGWHISKNQAHSKASAVSQFASIGLPMHLAIRIESEHSRAATRSKKILAFPSPVRHDELDWSAPTSLPHCLHIDRSRGRKKCELMMVVHITMSGR